MPNAEFQWVSKNSFEKRLALVATVDIGRLDDVVVSSDGGLLTHYDTDGLSSPLSSLFPPTHTHFNLGTLCSIPTSGDDTDRQDRKSEVPSHIIVLGTT